ncbi:MAG: hypothetical protein HY719_08800 [Planctomycetes bacterium]|nr:hypothetical protein [Planctomycetota bacterium]
MNVTRGPIDGVEAWNELEEVRVNAFLHPELPPPATRALRKVGARANLFEQAWKKATTLEHSTYESESPGYVYNYEYGSNNTNFLCLLPWMLSDPARVRRACLDLGHDRRAFSELRALAGKAALWSVRQVGDDPDHLSVQCTVEHADEWIAPFLHQRYESLDAQVWEYGVMLFRYFDEVLRPDSRDYPGGLIGYIEDTFPIVRSQPAWTIVRLRQERFVETPDRLPPLNSWVECPPETFPVDPATGYPCLPLPEWRPVRSFARVKGAVWTDEVVAQHAVELKEIGGLLSNARLALRSEGAMWASIYQPRTVDWRDTARKTIFEGLEDRETLVRRDCLETAIAFPDDADLLGALRARLEKDDDAPTRYVAFRALAEMARKRETTRWNADMEAAVAAVKAQAAKRREAEGPPRQPPAGPRVVESADAAGVSAQEQLARRTVLDTDLFARAMSDPSAEFRLLAHLYFRGLEAEYERREAPFATTWDGAAIEQERMAFLLRDTLPREVRASYHLD